MLYESLFYDKAVNHIFSPEQTVQYLLTFEANLALAQAQEGFIPKEYAQIIAECCTVKAIDVPALVAQVGLGGNVTIPLVKQLTVLVKQKSPEAAKFVHYGATSQDVIDTAQMLQAQASIVLMQERLAVIIAQLYELAYAHRHTVMIGRSFMQQARPITFGLKVVTWLDGLVRAKERLAQLSFYVQLGGAVGTLASMPDKGQAIAQSLASLLGLSYHPVVWHTQRDLLAQIATTVGLLSGSLGKIAKDISLLMQTEIAEVFEPSAQGKGGSSTMPHKRNPVSCIAILANAQRVPALVSTLLQAQLQDHERATGAWHTEWETLAQILQLCAGSLAQTQVMTQNLEVNTSQMLRNIEATQGLIFAENVSLALAEQLGKAEAHEQVEQWCKLAQAEGVHLKTMVARQQLLTPEQLEQLFNPVNALGFAVTMVESYCNKSQTAS